jgi:hypothetical protein
VAVVECAALIQLKGVPVNRRILLCSALAASLFLSVIGGGCDINAPIYRILLTNDGRDPIHAGGTRCPQNASTPVDNIGGADAPMSHEVNLSRDDINLGKLKFSTVRDPDQRTDIYITMTEPVYFDFHFESSDSTKVTVEYTKP